MAINAQSSYSIRSCDILLMRHGKTDWNQKKKLQGITDIPLNDYGEKEVAEEIQSLLFSIKDFNESYPTENKDIFNSLHNLLNVYAVYSSPLSRCISTAKIVCEHIKFPETQIQIKNNLTEANLGFLQGRTFKEIISLYPDDWNTFKNRTEVDKPIGNGESVIQKFDRVQSCLENIAEQNIGHRVLVVTHSGVLEDIYRKAMNIPMNTQIRVPKKNASFHLINIKFNENELPVWSIKKWNILNI